MFLDMSSTLGANLSSSPLRPSIEYANIIMRDDAGNAYLKNIGSLGANGYVFSGQGLLTNGVDQSVTIPIQAYVGSIIRLKTGSVVVENINAYVDTYVLDGNNIHMNFIAYADELTAEQIEHYEKYTETFMYVSNGELKSAVLDVGKVVSWCPLNEFDNYVRDYIKLSETPLTLITNGYFENDNSGWDYDLTKGTYTQYTDTDTGLHWLRVINNADIDNPVFTQTITVDPNTTYKLYAEIFAINMFNYTIKLIDERGVISSIYNKSKSSQNLLYTSGDTTTQVTIEVTTYIAGNTTHETRYGQFKISKLDGVYPIVNYTSSCRTGADYINYGLQNIFYEQDSNGVIFNYDNSVLHGNIGRRIDTGWYLDITKPFTIEVIQTLHNNIANNYELWGNSYSLGLFLGKYKWTDKRPYARIYGLTVIGSAQQTDVSLMQHTFDNTTGDITTYQDTALTGLYTIDTSTFTVSDVDVNLLQTYDTGGYSMYGTLPLIKIYNKVLTDEERQANYDKYKLQGLV